MAVVYRHIREDKDQVFYIGIGVEVGRAYRTSRKNKIWNDIVSKTNYRVEILISSITREEAIELEIGLIKYYGRMDTGTGTLSNMTDGGDGGPNFKGKKHTEEWKKNMSEILRGRSAVKSDEHKKKISKALKGRTMTYIRTEEHKQRIREAWERKAIEKKQATTIL